MQRGESVSSGGPGRKLSKPAKLAKDAAYIAVCGGCFKQGHPVSTMVLTVLIVRATTGGQGGVGGGGFKCYELQ